jgi:hypothetical protein
VAQTAEEERLTVLAAEKAEAAAAVDDNDFGDDW